MKIAWVALCVVGVLTSAASRKPLAGPVSVRRTRSLSAPGEGLEQILVASDGQPEDIGYGYQRAAARTTRPAFQGLLLLDKPGWRDEPVEAPVAFRERGLHLKRTLADDEEAADGGGAAVTSAFRERLAARQRRQRNQQQQQQQQHWNNWHRENPSINSFYPAGFSDTVDNPERYLQALREAWARYQQQTGTIDVGPDDLTDLETLQFLEALGADLPGPRARKRSAPAPAPAPAQARASGSSSPAAGGATPWDWSAPLAWSGYQLRKRSATPDFQDDSDEWPDEDDSAHHDDDDDGVEGLAAEGGAGGRLAMLLTQQLFDERYNDPAVKRLLLSKRSVAPAQRSPPAMRRRKKSTRPAANDPDVQRELAHIFGEPEPPEPPRALPLAAATSAPTSAAAASGPTSTAGPPGASSTSAAATPTTTSVPAKDGNGTTTKADAGQRGPMNPIGHAHDTDKLALEHAAHATPAPNVHVHVHDEHAPPMVAAEGPHGHDDAVYADEKEAAANKDKVETPALPDLPREEPRQLRIAKKSIDWSQYFGLDRRRKKSTSLNDVGQLDGDWLLRHSLMAFANSPKPSNINKRVAVKKEGASPDALLLGAWGAWGAARRNDGAWEDDQDDAEDYAASSELGEAGRCPAVTRLAEDCRRAVGSNDALLPLCVLYQACHLCGAAMGVPVGSSCEAELGRRGADLCTAGGPGAAGAAASDPDCRGAVEAIVEVYRSRHAADNETCTKQPCLAHFFLTAPAVAFAR